MRKCCLLLNIHQLQHLFTLKANLRYKYLHFLTSLHLTWFSAHAGPRLVSTITFAYMERTTSNTRYERRDQKVPFKGYWCRDNMIIASAFLNENVVIVIWMKVAISSRCWINKKASLVWIKIWHWVSDKPLSKVIKTLTSEMHICITWPQWCKSYLTFNRIVNTLAPSPIPYFNR